MSERKRELVYRNELCGLRPFAIKNPLGES